MNNLQEIRESIPLTQADVARQLGVTQGAISHYESHRRKPDLDTCRKIVDALNKLGAKCSLDDVFPPK